MTQNKKRYMYGAAVQGIQNYIFRTNELRDIVGASDVVERICTDLFCSELGKAYSRESAVVQAAGNIKYIFDDEALCRRVVREFPKRVVGEAPGVSISQAVVEFDDDFASAVDRLEERLREQRNRPMRPAQLGLMGMRRSRTTGLPAVEMLRGEYVDSSTRSKRNSNNQTLLLCRKAFGCTDSELNHRRVAYDTGALTGRNSWIAVIHADGNGLGQVVRKIGRDKEAFASFSRKLNEVTIASAVEAYRQTVEPEALDGKIPMRPVVLGGDDLTVIIRGDLALPFTESFLHAFERRSAEAFRGCVRPGKGLTACAGIAYIKASYPFYYGYELAEALCSRAKKHAKAIDEALAPSCVMMHKVQDSFVSNYADIVRRELTPCVGHSFEFGPYYLASQSDGRWTIEQLREAERQLSGPAGNALKSNLRQWLTAMHDSGGSDRAKQLHDRILTQVDARLESFADRLLRGVGRDGSQHYVVYDLLALCSIDNLETH